MGCHTLLRIERFCCCSTLRIGSLIIGYLGLMSYGIQVVGGSVQLAYFRDQYFLSHQNNNNYTIYGAGQLYMMVAKYMSVIIAYNVSLALSAASLLWGIHKRKSEFMLPWLVFQAVNFCSIALIMLVVIISFVVRIGAANVGFFTILGIFSFATWLSLYLYACVFSYYKEIKSKEECGKEECGKEENVPPPYITYLEEKKEVL